MKLIQRFARPSGLFACGLMAASCMAAAMVDTAPAAAPIGEAAHLLGLPDVPRNLKGTLTIKPEGVEFQAEKANAKIETPLIKSFYLEHDSKALIGGTAGKLILFAPFGSGRAISMIRPSIDVMTVVFADQSGGLHATVLFLPSGKGEEAATQMKAAGIAEGTTIATPPAPGAPVPKEQGKLDGAVLERLKRSTIVAEPVTFLEKGIPASYRAVIYEGTVERLRKSNRFQRVVRTGDTTVANDSDLLKMEIFVQDFKVGNPRMRSLTFFAGATDIKARLRIVQADGTAVMDRLIEGEVSHFGENIEASDSLSKAVEKLFAADDKKADEKK